jgi:site-specific DNA-methyltransferase (adenine-specific)
MLEINKIYNMDCLEGMKLIDDKNIDMILCDLPYGTTACKWDTIINFTKLWNEYKRIIKVNGAIVLNSIQPFTTKLINSNLNNFKHCWYWNKCNSGSFAVAKYRPLSIIEEICVFSYGKVNYFPVMEQAKEENKRPRNKSYKRKDDNSQGMASGEFKSSKNHDENLRYPKNLLIYDNRKGELNALNRLHPTQKPVEMYEYLIRTYSKENDLILDNCIGSGTTAVACINTNRNYIGFELDTTYCGLANIRTLDIVSSRQ